MRIFPYSHLSWDRLVDAQLGRRRYVPAVVRQPPPVILPPLSPIRLFAGGAAAVNEKNGNSRVFFAPQ
jgi:hypothetical protein